MIFSRQQVDTFVAANHTRIERILRGMVELVDLGPTATVPVEPRNPSRREQLSTDRADGWFRPTAKTASRRTGRSDPTGRQILAWEADVQRALTSVYDVLAQIVKMLTMMHIRPVDDRGRPIQAPQLPETRETERGVQIDVDPATCRREALAACRWLAAAVDAVAERMRDAEGDSGDFVADQVTVLETALRSVQRAVAPPRPRQRDLVRCELCGELAKYRKLQRCNACRMRELRDAG